MKLLGVRFKVLSEELVTLSDTKENLELSAICGEKECRVSFVEGEVGFELKIRKTQRYS